MRFLSFPDWELSPQEPPLKLANSSNSSSPSTLTMSSETPLFNRPLLDQHFQALRTPISTYMNNVNASPLKQRATTPGAILQNKQKSKSRDHHPLSQQPLPPPSRQQLQQYKPPVQNLISNPLFPTLPLPNPPTPSHPTSHPTSRPKRPRPHPISQRAGV